MLLGLFVNPKTYSRLPKGDAPSGIRLLAEEAVREGVNLVALTTFSVDWWEKRINGLLYSKEDGTWKVGVFPFPDVIYDRATLTKKELSVGSLVRTRFKEHFKIPYINNKQAFGKWNTFKILANYPEVKKHLPETCLYYHPLNLEEMLKKYQSVYIKASAGSMGRNIYKAQQAYQGVVTVSYREKGRNCSDSLTYEGIHGRLIKGKLKGKKVIIQQGIDLACLEDKPFDVRLLVQKDHAGTWTIVDKSVRLAEPGSVVTNVSSGASVSKFDDVIPQVFLKGHSKISQELELLTQSICRRLEESYGPQGELGIDMAVDKAGKLWLIEVNAKPSKISVRRSGDSASMYRKSGANDIIQRAYSNPVKYAKYLCRQGE